MKYVKIVRCDRRWSVRLFYSGCGFSAADLKALDPSISASEGLKQADAIKTAEALENALEANLARNLAAKSDSSARKRDSDIQESCQESSFWH